jgi:hypothetical protein
MRLLDRFHTAYVENCDWGGYRAEDLVSDSTSIVDVIGRTHRRRTERSQCSAYGNSTVRRMLDINIHQLCTEGWDNDVGRTAERLAQGWPGGARLRDWHACHW